MARDETARAVRREDENAADQRDERETVADGREDVSGGCGVGADELADDGGGRAVECDADRAEEEYDGPGRQTRRIVARCEDEGAVGEAECGHNERYGAEQDTDTVIHSV